MVNNKQGQKEYFQINDLVALEFVTVAESCINDDVSAFPLSVPSKFNLLNQLHTIDADNSSLLLLIGEKYRTIASYLKSTNDKINLLAKTLVHSDQTLTDIPRRTVSLSEGGLSFNNADPLDSGTYLAIKMILLPSSIGLLLYGQVINCDHLVSGGYTISIRFEQLSKINRQTIARHVLQYQAKARRELIAQNMEEKDN